MTKSAELQTAIGVGWRMGEVMQQYYNYADLSEYTKDENDTVIDETGEAAGVEGNSIVTEADLAISDQVVAFYAQLGRGVASEERGRTAEYGSPDAEYLDPIDGTKDFSQARLLGRQSLAGFSLGSVEGGRIVRGVVNFPLMAQPRLYFAEEGQAAYRVMEENGSEMPFVMDTYATEGAVLVSNTYDLFDEPLRARGFRPVHLSGAVFKACAVADSQLLRDYDPDLLAENEQIVGFLSHRASAHDYVGAAAIVRAAGGIASGMDGGELSLQAGKHGCIIANNEVTRYKLIEAAYAA